MISAAAFVGLCTLFWVQLKWRPEDAAFGAACSLIALLFLFGLADYLKLGTVLAMSAGVVSLSLNACLIVRNPNLRTNLLRPGPVMLAAAAIFLWVQTHSGVYVAWDEFSHWGTAIKVLYENDSLHRFHSLFLPSYPPGLALFAYFFLYPMGYSEGVAIFSTSLLCLVAFYAVVPSVGWNRAWLVAALLVIFYFGAYILGPGLATVTADNAMGFVFGGTIVVYLRHRSMPSAVPGLFLLPLIKPAGIALAAAAVAIITVDAMVSAWSSARRPGEADSKGSE